MSALLLIIALLLPPAPLARAVHVFIVEPTGEQQTAAEQTFVAASVVGAIDFWHTLAPTPTELTVTDTHMITVTGDPLASLDWSRPYLTDASSDVTIFVIDTSTNHGRLLGFAAGEAQAYYGAVWAVLDGYPGPDGLAATLAHELGHVLYGLDDAPGLDIMGYPVAAYHAHFIGCTSLAALGAPCRALYLPVVV